MIKINPEPVLVEQNKSEMTYSAPKKTVINKEYIWNEYLLMYTQVKKTAQRDQLHNFTLIVCKVVAAVV